jgi:hypothetical protein
MEKLLVINDGGNADPRSSLTNMEVIGDDSSKVDDTRNRQVDM